MDKLVINDIKFHTIIGIHPWEQSIKQLISLDLELAVNVKKAAEKDHIQDALDYDKLLMHILAFVDNQHFQLIETLAERLATEILTHFATPYVLVRIHKPGALKIPGNVSIQVERSK